MSQKLDAKKIDAALERAARKALHGTREERAGRFMAPKAFISYSHDSSAHKDWVLKLASDLRAKGVDVVLDQWDLVAGQDVSLFMQRGISEADRVIMICSCAYVTKSEQGVGGVGYERLIVTAEVVNSIDTIKFIPILRGASCSRKTPSFLGPRLYIDFENDSEYELKLIELAREIHGAPAISKPPLGPNPFSGAPIASVMTGKASPTAPSATDYKSLNDTWFFQEQARAQGLISKINLTGYMELRANVLHPLSKSQIELLNAVKLSEIRTFGWPIGITLENREEYRPRPYKDGIKAEISIAEGDRKSFDY
jgi:TIR domain